MSSHVSPWIYPRIPPLSCHYPCQCCLQVDGTRGGDAWIVDHDLPDWYHVDREEHIPRAPPT
jgi:hypothetical protein